jgi:hypothetical protein
LGFRTCASRRWLVSLVLLFVVATTGCTALAVRGYQATAGKGTFVVKYSALTGKKVEKLALDDSYLSVNIEGTNDAGQMVIVLVNPGGIPVAGLAFGPREKSSIEQLGPFPAGSYTVEITGQNARTGNVKLTFN